MACITGTLAVLALLILSQSVDVSGDSFEQVVELRAADSESCGPKLPVETPHCHVVEKKNGYELRKYPKGQVWVVTLVSNSSYSTAVSVGFYRLFYYISGKNEKAEIIEMTAPVVIHPSEKSDGYIIAFFAPSRYKSRRDLPKALDKNVEFVETEKEHTHAVLGPFGGFPTESDYEKKLDCLEKALDKDDVAYDKKGVLYAGYSSPFEFVNRKQEVHVVTKHKSADF